jgi:hypothetical protein
MGKVCSLVIVIEIFEIQSNNFIEFVRNILKTASVYSKQLV